MIIYLSGTGSPILEEIIKREKPYVLESFYYVNESTEKMLPYYKGFILDSGAFTFMQNRKGVPNWNEYVDRYAEFINKNKIERFFELDIDVLIGLENVKKLRDRLEAKTGRQSIPVWHTSRGYDEFIKEAEEYKYIALGGIVTSGKNSEQFKRYEAAFPKLISEAHKRGTKIHGLGYTSVEKLKQIHFDSVDSTRWNCIRFGRIEIFDGKTIRPIDCRKQNKRISKEAYGDALAKSFTEWCKLQKYAETHL